MQLSAKYDVHVVSLTHKQQKLFADAIVCHYILKMQLLHWIMARQMPSTRFCNDACLVNKSANVY